MSKIHILQHNDADGYGAAYLVKKYLTNNCKSRDIAFHVMSYKDNEVEDFLKEVEKDSQVWIVDYSLQPEKMIELLKITKDVIWIDHHATAINKYNDWYDLIEEATGVDNIKGIRLVGLCGAALTYQYLSNGLSEEALIELQDSCIDEANVLSVLKDEFEEKAPRWLRLVNDWDVWQHNYSDSKPFQIAIANDLSIELFVQLDNDFAEDTLCELLCKGESYLEYRDQWASTFRQRYGQVKGLDFKTSRIYDCYVMNLGNANSDFFGPEIDKRDICMNYCDNKESTEFSLYSNKSDVDVGAIAQTYGGGGHKGAAGFTIPKREARVLLGD